MMNYRVRKNFISKEMCEDLISDFISHTPSDAFRWHGGRKLIANTSIEFNNLLSKSRAWKKLSSVLASESFSKELLSELKIPASKFKITTFYSYFASNFSQLRGRSTGMIRNANPIFLIFWAFYSSIIRGVARGYANLVKLFGYNLVELFYDASSASNGYKREIHRDSDARVFVFLLYLNQIPRVGDSSGGELCIHTFTGSSGKIPAQPDIKESPIVDRLEPDQGTLVFFENDEEALHSVSEMSGFVGERYFIYGSLTLLSGQNKIFANSKEHLATDFRMYL